MMKTRDRFFAWWIDNLLERTGSALFGIQVESKERGHSYNSTSGVDARCYVATTNDERSVRKWDGSQPWLE